MSGEVVYQKGDGEASPGENRVFVTGTLQADDTVVASGSHRLVPGQRVRLMGEAAQQSFAD